MGLEPTTTSLENSDSTIELLMHKLLLHVQLKGRIKHMNINMLTIFLFVFLSLNSLFIIKANWRLDGIPTPDGQIENLESFPLDDRGIEWRDRGYLQSYHFRVTVECFAS